MSLSWTAAVKLVAGATEKQMGKVADELLDQIPREEWRKLLLVQLVSDAKRVQREDTLRAERAAEQRERRVKAAQWKEWGEKRQAAIRHELGLPKNAEPGEVLTAAFKQYESRMKMEWTRELLQSSFTLKDGTKVTWGQATVGQHLERVKMFSDQAELSMQGAERHRQAVRDIKEHQAACLDDVCAVTA